MPLLAACKYSRSEAVEKLMYVKGADVTVQDLAGNTPLHIACKNRLADAVRLLLEQQPAIDLTLENADGDTPLTLACNSGELDILNHLISKRGIDVSAELADTLLCIACRNGDQTMVDFLLGLVSTEYKAAEKCSSTSPVVAAYKSSQVQLAEYLAKEFRKVFFT